MIEIKGSADDFKSVFANELNEEQTSKFCLIAKAQQNRQTERQTGHHNKDSCSVFFSSLHV